MTLFATQQVEVTMNVVNYYNAATAMTVKPGARKAGYRHYAFNTDEQQGAESPSSQRDTAMQQQGWYLTGSSVMKLIIIIRGIMQATIM